ncbi:MAG: glycosyltransferase [Flavobacterium sp.]|nr:glycosyltransferase [Flavobacterium sp.]
MNSAILLIPHFNNPEGLTKSLRSIDANECIDVLIVDDGSKKEQIDEVTLKLAFKAKGTIYFEYLQENQGIENALNHGLQYILTKQYEYIARLDCGDMCLGERFRMQQQFLAKNREIKIVGTNVIAVGIDDKFLYKLTMPENHEEIRNKMYFNSMLIHPTVMFSKEILTTVGLYPTQYKWAEDYAFFFSIIEQYKAFNIQEYLSQIEINDSGISITKRKQQVKSRINIIKAHFYFGFFPIYGLIRNYVLLYMPYQLIFFIKKIKQ